MLVPLCFVVIGVAASMMAGRSLRQRAIEAWTSKAADDCARVSSTAVFWVSTVERDLRGIAALFYTSVQVTENELLDAVDLLAEGRSALPLLTVAYVVPTETGDYIIDVSTDTQGMLAKWNFIASVPEGAGTLLDALDVPERMAFSPSFSGDGDRPQVIMAQAVPSRRQMGVVLTLLDLRSLVEGLSALHIPEGIELRLLLWLF